MGITPDVMEDTPDILPMIREEIEDLRLTTEEGPQQYTSMFIDMRRIWEEINNIYQQINNIVSGEPRKAYAKAAAGAGSTIVCYLDTDGTGEEITVNVEIVGGSALNAAFPRLENGTLLTVWDDNGTWRNAGNPFQATGECP